MQRMNETWPEENWERFEPHVALTIVDLQSILGQTLGRDDIHSFEVLEGGKFNTNIKVTLAHCAPVVVRIYERDKHALKRDELIFELAKNKVPIPQMLGAIRDSSSLPDALAETLKNRPVGIFTFVEGLKPFEVIQRHGPATRPEIARALGHTLAKISPLKSFPAHGLLGPELEYKRRFVSNRASFEEFIAWSCEEGRAGQRLGPKLTKELLAFAMEHAPLFDVTEDAYGLVHGDYKFSNILLQPAEQNTWEVAAVLDWEFAFAGTPLADVAILFRHIDSQASDFTDAFTQGYEDAGQNLPPNWLQIARLWDLMNLCGFLNGSQHRQTTFDAVRALIAKTVGCTF